MVFTATGAVPCNVTKLFAVLKLFPPLLVIAKAEGSVANCERTYERRWLTNVLIGVGGDAASPAPRNAAYLASSSALAFAAASGPFTASCNARQYARRNGG